MGPLHLLIPNALVAADFAPELLRGLRLPNLDFLAAHALEESLEETLARPQAELTPWQAWLLHDDPQANLATLWTTGIQWPLPPGSAVWLAEPAHYQVGRDHLVLHDPAALADLDEQQAAALAAAARPALNQAGWNLEVVTPQRWLLVREQALDLSGAAIECAIGMNIASWMPTDQGSGAARQWLRVANEIQMTWHGHPVNEAREERGQLAVNALWLSGTGAHGLGRSINRLREYERIHSRLPLLVGYAECNADTADAADAAKAENAAAVGPVLKTWEGFIDPARRQDWSAWRNAAQALDAGMASVVAGLRSGRVASLDMILCAEQTLRIVRVRRSDFWKFWRRGSAVELFAEQD